VNISYLFRHNLRIVSRGSGKEDTAGRGGGDDKGGVCSRNVTILALRR
jgi:hypothetical protein